jgi:hypothetical protein
MSNAQYLILFLMVVLAPHNSQGLAAVTATFFMVLAVIYLSIEIYQLYKGKK